MIRSIVVVVSLFVITIPAAAQSIDDLGARDVALSRADAEKAGESVWSSAHFSGDATGAVVKGRSSNRSLNGWIRFGDGPWRELVIVFSATGDAFLAGFHGDEVYTDGRFAVRFDAPAEISAAGVFDNREDTDRLGGLEDGVRPDNGARPDREARPDGRAQPDDQAHPDGDAPPGKGTSDHVDPPRMYYRSDWGAEPFIGSPVALARPSYLYLTFHHAAGFGAHSLQEGIEQVKAIQTFHQNGRGWSDIGYQFVMDQNGRMYQGRPFLSGEAPIETAPALAMGAHVGGANTGNIGICALGCYHPPEGAYCEDVLSQSARDSLAVMLAFLSESYDVPPENLRGHRDFGATACPGDNNYALLDDLRERVREIQRDGILPKPGAYTLAENFPNPFTGSTTIRYFLQQEGVVRLAVFDALGRRIASLVDEHQDGDRWYGVDFEAADLAAGTYFYRIDVEGFSGTVFSETGSMVRVR